MTEIWRDIQGFEGIYMISNLGNLKSLDRIVNCKNGKCRIRRGVCFKVCKDNRNRYKYVTLWDRNGKFLKTSIHRLVAQAFIPNPDNLPEVNHKDENKANNKVDNLEWCTHKYNINYGTCKQRISKALTGNIVSEETKLKIHNAMLGEKNYFYGKHHTEETKKLQSLIKMGSNNPMYGRKHSEETKQKMRIKALNRSRKDTDTYEKDN